MPTAPELQEYLVIRGLLDRAGHFRLRRCGSTRYVREWPTADSAEYQVELLDVEGHPLHREPACVVPESSCEPGEAKTSRLTAYIGHREDAAAILLRRGEIVLWHDQLRPAPTFSLSISRAAVTRERPVQLRCEYSEPGESAFIQVVYQWGERRFLVAAVVPPTRRLDLDLAAMPGGSECRFVVEYSNGQRSAVAATLAFSLPALGPTLQIVRPAPRSILEVGQPLSLEGQVVDPERPGGPRPAETLSWWLGDTLVGRGPIAGLDRLPEGRHRILLRYAGARTEEKSVTVSVRPGGQPPADQWQPWDEFSDPFGFQEPTGPDR